MILLHNALTILSLVIMARIGLVHHQIIRDAVNPPEPRSDEYAAESDWRR